MAYFCFLRHLFDMPYHSHALKLTHLKCCWVVSVYAQGGETIAVMEVQNIFVPPEETHVHEQLAPPSSHQPSSPQPTFCLHRLSSSGYFI